MRHLSLGGIVLWFVLAIVTVGVGMFVITRVSFLSRLILPQSA